MLSLDAAIAVAVAAAMGDFDNVGSRREACEELPQNGGLSWLLPIAVILATSVVYTNSSFMGMKDYRDASIW